MKGLQERARHVWAVLLVPRTRLEESRMKAGTGCGGRPPLVFQCAQCGRWDEAGQEGEHGDELPTRYALPLYWNSAVLPAAWDHAWRLKIEQGCSFAELEEEAARRIIGKAKTHLSKLGDVVVLNPDGVDLLDPV